MKVKIVWIYYLRVSEFCLLKPLNHILFIIFSYFPWQQILYSYFPFLNILFPWEHAWTDVPFMGPLQCMEVCLVGTPEIYIFGDLANKSHLCYLITNCGLI